MLWLKEYSRQSNNRLVLCRSACSNRPVPGCAVRSTFSLRAKDELTFSFEGNTLEQHSSVEAAFQDKYATSYYLVPIVRNDHSVGNFTIHILRASFVQMGRRCHPEERSPHANAQA